MTSRHDTPTRYTTLHTTDWREQGGINMVREDELRIKCRSGGEQDNVYQVEKNIYCIVIG